MNRYIRTKDGKIYDTDRYAYVWTTPRFIGLGISATESILIPKSDLIKEPTDDLEELISIGDVVFYWNVNDCKEHSILLVSDFEMGIARGSPLTRWFIPSRDDYKCIAAAKNEFKFTRGGQCLVKKGDLELL